MKDTKFRYKGFPSDTVLLISGLLMVIGAALQFLLIFIDNRHPPLTRVNLGVCLLLLGIDSLLRPWPLGENRHNHGASIYGSNGTKSSAMNSHMNIMLLTLGSIGTIVSFVYIITVTLSFFEFVKWEDRVRGSIFSTRGFGLVWSASSLLVSWRFLRLWWLENH